MRGCLQKAKLSAKTMASFKKGECRWRIILSLGRGADSKYKQRWISFTGTRKQAEVKLRELTGEVDRGEFIEPSKITVGAWLDQWVESAAKPPRLAENTYTTYKNIIDAHLKPALGAHTLQRLAPMHIERYYAESKLAPRTMAVHHAVLTSALKAAVKNELLRRNPAERVTNKPRIRTSEDVLDNVWTAEDARKFLTAVKQTQSAQQAALFALALDGGLRNGELLGLQWQDIDFTSRSLRVERQLLKWSEEGLITSLPKGKRARSLDLSEETVVLLREHKRQQAELKMANRPQYVDHGLIFAQAWEHQSSRHSVLGGPLHKVFITRQLEKLCGPAGVKRISAHGLRHTCATLLLSASVAAHVVQRRLGHKNIAVTLDIYGHVLPSMQQDAASRLATLLHG